jgi:hypothetical protein
MTRTAFRLSDLGEVFTWVDLRDFINHLPATQECALYRARFPKSWWWTPDMDFLSAILNTVQWANWQRGGNKSAPKPKPIKRPKEAPKNGPKTSDELLARRSRIKRKAV